MEFVGYKKVPVYNKNGTIAYYQLEMTWKENKNGR